MCGKRKGKRCDTHIASKAISGVKSRGLPLNYSITSQRVPFHKSGRERKMRPRHMQTESRMPGPDYQTA